MMAAERASLAYMGEGRPPEDATQVSIHESIMVTLMHRYAGKYHYDDDGEVEHEGGKTKAN